MRLNTAPEDRRDAGYTLIELLITVVILGVITVPLGNAVIGIIRNTDATSDRLVLSHDAQISAAYFARDVASVGMRDYAAPLDASGNLAFKASIQLDAAYNAGGSTCGTAATPTAKIRFLSDDWDNSGATPVVGTDIVAYYFAPPVGGVSELHRLKCASAPSSVSDVVLAHSVDPATPAVTCTSPGACDTAAVPQQVTLTFSVTKPSVGGYSITLNGQRRQA